MRSWHWTGCWSCRSRTPSVVMRLWSLHPRYLDSRGLVALWREALLAQAVLRGQTKGYTRHPQLARFQSHRAPVAAIATYLSAIHVESLRRGFHFKRDLIGSARPVARIPVSRDQLAYEWAHLKAKLHRRDRVQWSAISDLPTMRPHPLFRVVNGPLESWEKRKAAIGSNGTAR